MLASEDGQNAVQIPINTRGSCGPNIAGRPAYRYQAHGCVPYSAEPPVRTLKRRKFQGANTRPYCARNQVKGSDACDVCAAKATGEALGCWDTNWE